MYEVIGLKTKKIYAVEERRNDCFRNLQSDYPYINGTGKGVPGKVYPEPLLIRRIEDERIHQEVQEMD